MPTLDEMFDVAEASKEEPQDLDSMFDAAEQKEKAATARDVQQFGVEAPARAISALESALPVGLQAQNRMQRKEALKQATEEARTRGAEGAVDLKIAELAQRTIEPLTPAGLMNQPARLVGRPDVYEAGKPLVQIPRNPALEGTAAGGVANLAFGAIEALTTPEMLVTAPGLGASALARGVMAYDMARHIPEQVAQSAETLGTPESTAQEKVEAIGAPLISAFFSGALARGHVAAPKEIPLQTGKALELPSGARMPRIEAPEGIQRVEPAQAEQAAKRMQRTATAAYEPPRTPRATVPEGPLEPEVQLSTEPVIRQPKEITTWDDIVADFKARATGAETRAQIQAMYPELRLSNEVAASLAKQVFGEGWKPGGAPRAPAPKPVEGLTPAQQEILAKARTTTMTAEERALAEKMMAGELERPSEAQPAPAVERTPSEAREMQREEIPEAGRSEVVQPTPQVVQQVPVEPAAQAPAPSPIPEAPKAPEPVVERPITATMESAREVLNMSPADFARRAKSFNKVNLELGRKVTDAELAELEQMAAQANERWKQARKRAETEKTPEAMNEMMALSSQPQYFNEAIAEARKLRERKPDVAQGEVGMEGGRPQVREELRNVPEQGQSEGAPPPDVPVQEPVTPTVETKAAETETKPAEPATEAPSGETQGAAATAASAGLPPATATATLSKPIKPVSQIIRELSKGISTPIRFGRMRNTRVGGFFEPVVNAIRVRKANKMPIVSHEAGHRLDALWEFSKDKSIMPELDRLGDNTTPGSMSSWTKSKSLSYKYGEGMAEFVRHWLIDPAKAKADAPNTFAKFEQVLDANSDFGDVMRQAQSDVATFRNAPVLDRFKSHISTENPLPVRYSFPKLMRDVIDDLQFAKLFMEDVKKSGPVAASKNIYQLMRAYRGIYGMADTWVNKGSVDFKSRAVTLKTSLKDALAPVRGDIDNFRAWITARRAVEMEAQGKESGFEPGEAKQVADMFDSNPNFKKAYTGVRTWLDSLLQYAEDAGMIEKGKAKEIIDSSAFYVPMHRVMEVGAGELAAQGTGGTGKGFKPSKPGSLKTARGGSQDIIDPIETMVKNAFAFVSAAEKNAINIALADLSKLPDMGKWIQRAAGPKEKLMIDIERIRKQLEDAGADVEKVPDDLLLTLWRPRNQPAFGENMIMVNRAGKPEFYQVDPELFKVFNSLDYESAGLLMRAWAAPGQVLRAGVTLTPRFALFNAFRDAVSSSIVSRYGIFPFEATARGFAAMIKNPKLVAEWAASGGKQSVEASYFDRDAIQKFMRERITKDLTPSEQAMIVAKSPLTALRFFTTTLEEATRIGEYQIVYNRLLKEGVSPGEARRQAAYEARDLQDFAKGGAQTKVVRMLTPFFNATIQGNVRLAQAFREKPFQTVAKGLAYITIPKLIEQALNWNDQDYWDRPQWERDIFFLLPAGKDENGRTRFVRLPTPFEAGIIFGTIPGRILQWAAKNDPEGFKDFPSMMLKTVAPNPVPQSLVTIGEVMANNQGYSFWRGRPIVPEALKNEAPELRTTAQDSVTAKKLGELLGIAPAKVEYSIQGIAGGLGKGIVHSVVDPVVSAATGTPRTAESKSMFGAFITTPAGTQSESVERFYNILERAKSEASRAKHGRPADYRAELVTPLSRIADQMSDLRKMARNASTAKERQQHQLRIAELAKQGIEISRQKAASKNRLAR